MVWHAGMLNLINLYLLRTNPLIFTVKTHTDGMDARTKWNSKKVRINGLLVFVCTINLAMYIYMKKP